MKLTFKHLVDAYKEYESIQSSYKGGRKQIGMKSI